VAAVIVAAHQQAAAIEKTYYMGIAPGMFAQSVHQQDAARRRHASSWRPVGDEERDAVCGRKLSLKT
jgi:hypothetical protein